MVAVSSAAAVETSSEQLLEKLLLKYADRDVALGFGMKEPDRTKGAAAFTFPEDAFLADRGAAANVRFMNENGYPAELSAYYKQLPDYDDVLSSAMYRFKRDVENASAHCKHVNQMFLYLLRKAGGARKGTQGCISAPYFDPSLVQSFDFLLPPGQRGRKIKMPQQIRDSYEQRTWKVYGDFVKELDAFFAAAPAQEQETQVEDQDFMTAPGHEQLSIGAAVVIKGVESKPELNGCVGVIEDINDEKQRYALKIIFTGGAAAEMGVGDAKTKSSTIRPSVHLKNLELPTPFGTKVAIKGLVAKPEYNGRSGVVRGFMPDKNRYRVELVQMGEGAVQLARPLSLQAKNFDPVQPVVEQEASSVNNSVGDVDPSVLVDALSLDLDLTGYSVGGSSGHGMLIFKIKDYGEQQHHRFRVVHSFAHRFSMSEWMRSSSWMDQSEALEYLLALKAAVFSRAHEKEQAREGFEKLFAASSANTRNAGAPPPLIKADFDDVLWQERHDFSNGQSLSKWEIRGVQLKRFLRVLDDFYVRFERMAEESDARC